MINRRIVLCTFFLTSILLHGNDTLPQFPKRFVFGGGSSSAQAESYDPNRPHQFARFIEECNQSTNPNNHKVLPGDACKFETTYKDYIIAAASIGLKVVRFSIAWEKVNPAPGIFDEQELNRYANMCATCNMHGITPLITLYHYTEPTWFWDLGSFEKAENGKYFVDFCTQVFKKLHGYNPLWVTFNTPSGVMGKVYIKGERPKRMGEEPRFKPGSDCIKARDFYLAGTALANILNTHVAVYKTLKAIDPSAQIGFLKNIQQHDPYNPWSPLDLIGAIYANWMADDSIIYFLRTGIFRWLAPVRVYVSTYNADAPTSFDFIGLNYYTRDFIRNFEPVQKEGDPKTTSSDKVIYPEGMYRALMTLQKNLIEPIKKSTGREIPIYVTENGISPLTDEDRKIFYEGYLASIKRAMDEGVDVRGYIVWALMDNWEWGKRKESDYGIFAVDPETKKPILKTNVGTKYLLEVIKKNQE